MYPAVIPNRDSPRAILVREPYREGGKVLWDVTSTYFEGRHCALARPGYSRDHRPDRPQIVFGLLPTAEGCPVEVEVFPGNTADPQTLDAAVTQLREGFGLSHLVVVGDRGMITQARISLELEPRGLDWIAALRAPQVRHVWKKGPLQLSLFDEQDLAEITSPDFPASTSPSNGSLGPRPCCSGPSTSSTSPLDYEDVYPVARTPGS